MYQASRRHDLHFTYTTSFNPGTVPPSVHRLHLGVELGLALLRVDGGGDSLVDEELHLEIDVLGVLKSADLEVANAGGGRGVAPERSAAFTAERAGHGLSATGRVVLVHLGGALGDLDVVRGNLQVEGAGMSDRDGCGDLPIGGCLLAVVAVAGNAVFGVVGQVELDVSWLSGG